MNGHALEHARGKRTRLPRVTLAFGEVLALEAAELPRPIHVLLPSLWCSGAEYYQKAETETEVQQETVAQPEQEVAVEEEASEDENAIEEQETDLHQVIVNGEKIDVDLEELKAGYQKDADYRRKTEELAIEKRELKAEEDRLNKQYSTKMEDLNSLVATLNAEINNDINSKELDALWEEDPTEAAKVDRRIQKRKNTIQQAQQKLRDHQQAQFQEILELLALRTIHSNEGVLTGCMPLVLLNIACVAAHQGQI